MWIIPPGSQCGTCAVQTVRKLPLHIFGRVAASAFKASPSKDTIANEEVYHF